MPSITMVATQRFTSWDTGALTYTDPNFMAKVLPEIFRCCHTDDYPGVKVTILYDDGSRTVISSHSQSEFMLPWKVEGGNATVETFNKNISVALAGTSLVEGV